MLNKNELISAFQGLANQHLIPGKRENDKRRVYGIIIDDVRIENLNKFIKKHFIETERSAGGTFKQVTSNYIDAASYFTDHELSLMFYTCFSYKTVYYMQYGDKSLSIDYKDSSTKINRFNYITDTKHLVIDENIVAIPATPNNYYIPQHFDITNANLGELESHMDKALGKARSIYVKLYDYEEGILKSIKEYENTINNADLLKAKEVKLLPLYYILGFLGCLILSSILGKWGMETLYSLLILASMVCFISIFLSLPIYSKNKAFEEAKTKRKGELLEACKFLKDCYYSHRSDEKLSKLEKYKNIFIFDNNKKKKKSMSDEKLLFVKQLSDTYNQIKEKLEEGWKATGGKSVYYEFYDKLGWDYDINIAKEKFSGDDEL